jgi:HTH-type transcriptional regulator/antitoxin HigA
VTKVAKIIKNKKDHENAMNRIAELMAADPVVGSAAGDELELLAHLVQDYETKHHDIGLPTPLQAIRFRMEQQNLRPKDLIPYLGSASRVSEVLGGKRRLSLEMVRKLNNGLGIPAEVLLQERRKQDVHDASEELSSAVAKLPADVFKEVVRRKWFDKFRGNFAEAKQKAVSLWKEFLCFGTDPYALLAFNRQSVRAKQNDFALFAWRTRVLRIASKKRLENKFDAGDITDAFVRALASFSRVKDGPGFAVEELEKNGIAVVIESHLPRTHLDGAAMKLPDGTPVIGLTLRYDRLDNFFFCLFHELGHVVKHIATGKAELFLDDLEQRSTEKLEKEADAFTREHLIPEREWQQFWEAGDFAPENVRRVAKRIGIHGAILAGRVRKAKNDYQILSRLVHEAKVRQILLRTTCAI